MVGERDREQDELSWDEDTAGTAIPPPFNNGILSYNKLQQQQQQHHHRQYADIAPDADAAGRWYDERDFGLMGGESVGAGQAARGVRFPEASPTNGFYNSQLSQAALEKTHSR